jgi:hypothetical protein
MYGRWTVISSLGHELDNENRSSREQIEGLLSFEGFRVAQCQDGVREAAHELLDHPILIERKIERLRISDVGFAVSVTFLNSMSSR